MKPKRNKTSPNTGVLYSIDSNGKMQDEHLHAELLPEVSAVADEAAIRILMKMGYTRADACRFIFPSQNTPDQLPPTPNESPTGACPPPV